MLPAAGGRGLPLPRVRATLPRMGRRKGRKLRVDFRQNRAAPRRESDWTRRYQDAPDRLIDERTVESVRAKGDLSRKRTVIVDDDAVPVADPAHQGRGVVAAVYGLVSRVVDDDGREWACTVRRVLRTLLIEQRSVVAVGDRVWYSPAGADLGALPSGVIERVEPRTTSLSRREFRGREHLLVANADQLLIISSVAQPRFKPHLIDRYLVAAGKGGLRPVVCLNKADLAEPQPDDLEREDAIHLADLLREYESLGYACLCTSAVTGAGLDQLREHLRGRMTVLSGQSGVGKTSLLNALQPGLHLAVQEVSGANQKGRHTTTHARLLRLDFGGYVVDTPGIRAFDLWNVAPGELEAHFVEFVPHLPQCRFHNCLHRDEIGCAVRAAVERGEISARRYWSYLKLFDEV